MGLSCIFRLMGDVKGLVNLHHDYNHRMSDLEKSQNALINRVSKLDNVVAGLRQTVTNIRSKIMKIVKICEVPLNENDNKSVHTHKKQKLVVDKI